MTTVTDDEGRLTREPRLAKDVSLDERRDLAIEIQRVAFEHLTSRLLLHLGDASTKDVRTVVVSGGVASNQYLRHVIRSTLNRRGFESIGLEFPPVSLCTDNALMIAWSALEMWNAGFQSELSVEPLRKWSMDSKAEDGGILGVGGWVRRSDNV